MKKRKIQQCSRFQEPMPNPYKLITIKKKLIFDTNQHILSYQNNNRKIKKTIKIIETLKYFKIFIFSLFFPVYICIINNFQCNPI